MRTTLKLEGEAWSNFLDVELAPLTKSLYSRWIQIFMKYYNIENPDKPLELGTTVPEIEDKIIKWLGTLKDTGKATATMRTALACVVFFYSCNRIKIDSKFIGRRIPKRPALPHRSPRKEEVGAIVEAGNLRGKALVCLLASTGIRLGAIPSLKVRHRRKAMPNELEHYDCSRKNRSEPLRFDGYLLNVYEEEEHYFTFKSEEAAKWLDIYHKMREIAGETLKPNTPLIREEFDVEKPEVVNNPSISREEALQSTLSHLTISAGVKPIVRKEQIKHPGGHRSEWKNVHGYRMFFSTAATNAGVNFSFKELMLGHHLNLEKSYYESNNPRSVHAALAEYLKMQDAVTIFSTSRLERDNAVLREQVTEIQDLREDNIKLDKIVAKLAKKLESS